MNPNDPRKLSDVLSNLTVGQLTRLAIAGAVCLVCIAWAVFGIFDSNRKDKEQREFTRQGLYYSD